MKRYLVTGGTGSFGRAMVHQLLAQPTTELVRVLSRCEHKQFAMRQEPRFMDPRLKFTLGNVLDYADMAEACVGVDAVVHAAALKHIDRGEEQPDKFAETNISGSLMVFRAAWHANVNRVLCISSDKAVSPLNLYGASKKLVEGLAISMNRRMKPTIFSCARWGNVWGSHGSVMEKWAKHPAEVTIFGEDMTRFVLPLEVAAQRAYTFLHAMTGGEIFVPSMSAVTVETIYDYFFPDGEAKICRQPKRGGEKEHEVLISDDEVPRTKAVGPYYVVYPAQEMELPSYCERAGHVGFKPIDGPVASNTAPQLDVAGLRELVG